MQPIALLAISLASFCSATPLVRTLQIRQEQTPCRWNISYLDYVPAISLGNLSIPLLNFVINRPDDAHPYTYCTSILNSSSTAWHNCSYYQYANGSKSGDLSADDAHNLRWRVPIFNTTLGSERLHLKVTNGVRTYVQSIAGG